MKKANNKKKFRGPLYTFLTIVGIIVVIAMILSMQPVADQVSKWTGIAADKIKSGARTVIGVGLGVALVTWGIAALSVPVLGGAMILIGLGLLAYSLWPLFKSKTSSAQAASFDSSSPLKIFGT